MDTHSFRSSVYEVINECCGDIGVLNMNHDDYGETTLNEIELLNNNMYKVVNALSNKTGMPITSEISNKWVTISDIENTLSDFFK